MHEFRQLVGYATGLAILVVAVSFSFIAIAIEGSGYVPKAAEGPAKIERPTNVEVAEVQGTRDNPVWIAPTPKYQYDPKLMELKPPHQMKAEAERRRQQAYAAHQSRQREAKLRAARNREAARDAFASVRDPSPPAFLMFSLQ